MQLREIIKAEKSVIDWGKWQEGGKMPRAAFPLSKPKNRAYKLPSYRWCVVTFDALGQSFRLLVAYRIDKEQYRAVLAADYGRDMAVLAQLEFHGTHPGWHVLASCDDVETIPKGVMRHPWQQRLPKARARARRTEFRVNHDGHAMDAAIKTFGLNKEPGVLRL